jgi:hypothetical protein
MSQINIASVLKGGVAAGVIMNISEYILNGPVAGAQMNQEFAALNLPPVGTAQVVVFAGLTMILGIMTVWLYAAIRPRFGPGPRTATWAGLVIWALAYGYSSLMMGLFGISSMGIVVLGVVWTAIEMIVASSIGGYLYSEGD